LMKRQTRSCVDEVAWQDNGVVHVRAAATCRPRTSAQNLASLAASWASKLMPKTVVRVMIVYLSVWRSGSGRSQTAVHSDGGSAAVDGDGGASDVGGAG
jgi:hypothetical protein